jgi:Skp family chaperone for outer membrane proteins
MKNLFLAIVLAVASGLPAVADLRVAVIDTSKAFDAYYRTKNMAVEIAAKKADFEKQLHAVQAEYDNANQEAQDLSNAVKDTSIAADVRKSKDAALAEKVQDLQSIEQDIDQKRREFSSEIHDELLRSHQEISDEIMRVITAYVSRLGYDVVFDSSPSANAGPPLFPYNSQEIVDLTPEIIARLNSTAAAH